MAQSGAWPVPGRPRREEPSNEEMSHEKLQLSVRILHIASQPTEMRTSTPALHGSVSWAPSQHSGERAALDGSYPALQPLELRCAGQRLTPQPQARQHQGPWEPENSHPFTSFKTTKSGGKGISLLSLYRLSGSPGQEGDSSVKMQGDDLCTVAELRHPSWWKSKCSWTLLSLGRAGHIMDPKAQTWSR